MSEPKRNMISALLDKLRYGGVTGPEGLTANELGMLADNRRLRRELELNQALWFGRPLAPEAPAVAGQISLALGRRAATETLREEQGKMRSWLIGKQWYWQAAAVIALAALVVAIAALWPWRMDVTPGGIDVGRETAWATVDGYVLDYTIEFDEHFTGTAADSPDHPLWQVQALVDEWTAAHAGELAPGGAFTTAEMQIESTHRQFGQDLEYYAEIQITARIADRQLVDELTRMLAVVENLSEPEVYSRQWYYSEKYPKTHYLGREIIINGRRLLYPHEITENDLSLLRNALNIYPAEDGLMLYALDDIAEFQRYGLGDVVSIAWDDGGAIRIDNQPFELDFSELEMPGWVHQMGYFIPGGEKHLDLDPVDLMRKHAGIRSQAGNQPYTAGMRLIVDLLPGQALSGLPVDDVPAGFSAGQIAEAGEMIEKYEAAVAGLIEKYPKAEEYLSTEVVKLAGVPVQWTAKVRRHAGDNLVVLLRERLLAQGAPDVVSLPALPEPGQSPFTGSVLTKIKQTTTISVPLLQVEDEHGTDDRLAVWRASEKQKQSALDSVAPLLRLVDDWSARKRAGGRAVLTEVRLKKAGGIPVSAVVLFGEESDLGEELTGELIRAGFTGAALSGDHPVIQPLGSDGKVLVTRFFNLQRFTGVSEEDTAAAFTAEDFARAERLRDAAAGAVDSFLAAHGGGRPGSGCRIQAGGWELNYGGLPVGYGIPTNLQEGAELDALIARLAAAGLPEPEVLRRGHSDARDPWQETLRRRNGSHDIGKNNVLVYYLPYSSRRVVCTEDNLPMVYTDAERREAAGLLARMQAALDDWLADRPADMAVRLETKEHGGIILEIQVLCDSVDEDTVLALGDALAVEGAPVYQYGGAFLHRPKPEVPVEERDFILTKVNWCLLPQVRVQAVPRDGNYLENLKAEFTADEIAHACECRKLIRLAHGEWVESHPEISDAPDDLQRAGQRRVTCMDVNEGDVHTLISIQFYLEDKQLATELADDLKKKVAAAGVGIRPYITQSEQTLRFRLE